MAKNHKFSDDPQNSSGKSISPTYLAYLAEKFLQGTATLEEEEILEAWYRRQPPSRLTFFWKGSRRLGMGKAKKDYKEHLLKSIQLSSAMDAAMAKPERRHRKPLQVSFNRKAKLIVRSLAATAAVVLIVFAWSYLRQPSMKPLADSTQSQVIVPGSDGAVLTLSDGREIHLDSTVEGQIAGDDQRWLIKKGSVLKYALSKGDLNNKVSYNTMTTHKGRQFQLVLPDGTKVWLNAASSIHYPTAFTESTREVSVTGEVYFEVTHRTDQPFIVHTEKTKIEVLGTRFDVMAYADEKEQTTTLLEGKVLLRSAANQKQYKYLNPGQQAHLEEDGRFQVMPADTSQVMAWVGGKLSMKNLDVATLMRQIARWYNIDIQYAGEIPKGRFGGVLNRSAQLKSVLEVMEFSGIRTKLVGRTLIVEP